jgi:hypothetical protein
MDLSKMNIFQKVTGLLGVILFFQVSLQAELTRASKVQASPKEMMDLQKKFAEATTEINENPEVKKLKEAIERAQKAYMEAVEKEMAKKDPVLLENYKQMRDARMEWMKSQFQTTKAQPTGFDSLSEAEKTKVSDARRQAMDSASVREAKGKRNAAKTAEERTAADRAYKAALRGEMMKIDKELGPLIEKVEAKSPDKRSPDLEKAEKH